MDEKANAFREKLIRQSKNRINDTFETIEESRARVAETQKMISEEYPLIMEECKEALVHIENLAKTKHRTEGVEEPDFILELMAVIRKYSEEKVRNSDDLNQKAKIADISINTQLFLKDYDENVEILDYMLRKKNERKKKGNDVR